MAKIIANNSVWRIETQHSLNAINGTNHRGTVIRFYNKRTGQEIAIPLTVFLKTTNSITAEDKEGVTA